MTSSRKSKVPRVIVDPCFALDWRDLNDFIGEFGPYNGRYVPSFPQDWVKRMRVHIDDLDLQPRKRAEMIAKVLQYAQLCTVQEKWAWNDDISWKDNVQSILADTDDSIVVGDALDPLPYNSWPDSVDEIRASRVGSRLIKGSVNEYVELCKPLLLMSPTAYLIDPYIDPLSQEIEFLLRRFFDLIKGSKCYSIELIRRWPYEQVGVKLSEADFEKQLNDTYQSLVPKGRSLKVHCAVEGRKHIEFSMHDRFFLTKHGGLSFGYGFMVVEKGVPNKYVSVVSANDHETLKRTYLDGVAHFKDRSIGNIDFPRPRDGNPPFKPQ